MKKIIAKLIEHLEETLDEIEEDFSIAKKGDEEDREIFFRQYNEKYLANLEEAFDDIYNASRRVHMIQDTIEYCKKSLKGEKQENYYAEEIDEFSETYPED